MGIEIERKWLMDKRPEGLKEIDKFTSRQWYLSHRDTVVRVTEYTEYKETTLRKCFDENQTPWVLTIKNQLPVGLNRDQVMRREDEYYLSSHDFHSLTDLIKVAPVIVNVTIYEMPDGKILEYKEVDSALPTAVKYAEIEFDSIEECEAYQFNIPHVDEVTQNPYHKMKNYWVRTRGHK